VSPSDVKVPSFDYILPPHFDVNNGLPEECPDFDKLQMLPVEASWLSLQREKFPKYLLDAIGCTIVPCTCTRTLPCF